MKLVSLVVLCILIFASSCSNPSLARNAANDLAAWTTRVKDSNAQYSQFRDDFANARIANIEAMESNAAATQRNNDAELAVLSVSGAKSRILLYKGIRQASESAEASPAAPNFAALDKLKQQFDSDTSSQTKNLAGTSTSLAQLGKTPNLLSDAEFLASFGGDVQKAIKKSQAASKCASEKGTKMATNHQSPAATSAKEDAQALADTTNASCNKTP